jgi:hypothetical protein
MTIGAVIHCQDKANAVVVRMTRKERLAI